MGHGRSEDYWSFETIIVISKAMQDQFQVDWLAHFSSVCQLFCLRETLWFDSVAVFTFFSFCCLFIYQKKLTDSEYLVTQNWSQISSGFGWLH